MVKNDTIDPVRRQIGERIRELLERKKASQSELARHLTKAAHRPCTPQAVQSWISGKTSPSRKYLPAMADFLQTTEEYITFGTPEGDPPQMPQIADRLTKVIALLSDEDVRIILGIAEDRLREALTSGPKKGAR